MRPEFIVALKEFKDYLSSKRFLLIFAVLMIMCIAAVIAGVSSYNSQLSSYNQAITRAATQNATAGGFSFQPQMPSMMLIFRSFSTSFITVGWLLAIGIGFDLISKEKESGSLKLLLARPIFRDSIINGKILGSSAILILSLAATFLVAVALLLFQGIIPAGDDLVRMVAFFLALVLFCVSFLAIGIAASAISKNSTMAILLAIGFVVFSLLVPSFSSTISGIILGEAPSERTVVFASGDGGMVVTQSVTTQNGTAGGNANFRPQVSEEYTAYIANQNMITGILDLLSPTSDLTSIASVIVSRQSNPSASQGMTGLFEFNGVSTTPSLGSSIWSILPQVISLLVITIAGFVISYAKFIRMDVR